MTTTPAGTGDRVRVLHVITHLDHGGATDNTLLTVAGLDRSRYRVDLAAGPGDLEAKARAAADRLFLLPGLARTLGRPADVRAAGARFLRLVRWELRALRGRAGWWWGMGLAAVALTAYGAYRVSHPPTLKPPPVPSLP